MTEETTEAGGLTPRHSDDYQGQDPRQTLHDLGSDVERGLSQGEAEARLKRFGLNEVAEGRAAVAPYLPPLLGAHPVDDRGRRPALCPGG